MIKQGGTTRNPQKTFFKFLAGVSTTIAKQGGTTRNPKKNLLQILGRGQHNYRRRRRRHGLQSFVLMKTTV